MKIVNSTPLNDPINFTQGDSIVLNLLALDNEGDPVDLTGASLTTQMLGANIVGPVIFGPSQHNLADQSTNPGEFTLTLSTDDTVSVGLGEHKQILTQSAIAGAVTYFHGNNILTVYPPVPLQ